MRVTTYSTIILGGGTMGTAAAWELAKRDEKALVLEQFSHVHAFGAHGGQTRVIRHAYSEDPDYVPLVLRADDLWVELENASGTKLLHRVGAVELTPSAGHGHAERARASAELHGLEFEWLDAAEVRRRWPQLQVDDHWHAGFGPKAGFLEVEPSLRAMASLARASGVDIHENEPAVAWGASDAGVWVKSGDATYNADRLIITAGAWSGAVLAELGLPLRVVRKTLWWLDVARPDELGPDTLPVFMAEFDDKEIYGFPIFGQPGLKIANHRGGDPTTIDTVERTTAPGEEAEIVGAARSLFGDDQITGNVLKSAVCLYTNTPDGNFIIDRHPDHDNVVIGAGFSGHGFKFTPAVGELLVALLDDAQKQPPSILALDRFR